MQATKVLEIKERILKAFERVGILIDDTSLDLMEYIGDSVNFITAVVELEDEFEITFPNDLLNYEVFQGLDNLIEIINNLVENEYIE